MEGMGRGHLARRYPVIPYPVWLVVASWPRGSWGGDQNQNQIVEEIGGTGISGMHAPIRTHQFLLRHFYLQSKGPGEGLCGFCQTQTLCLIFYGLYPSGQVRVVESSVYKLVGRSKVENAFKVQIQCCQSHVPTSLLWQTGTQLIFISQISMHLLSFLSILGTGQHNRTK
jgi:hypothetical protein